jgi:Flp pilus assembly protein TadB
VNQPATPARTTPSIPVVIDNAPPRRSKVAGAVAALACAACCALPLLIAAGVLTGSGAAILAKTLYAVAVALVTVALGMWWLHRRRSARRAAAAGTGCGYIGSGCGC